MRRARLTFVIVMMIACPAIAVFAWAASVRAQEAVPDYDGPKYQLDSKEENVLKIYNLFPSGATNSYCLSDEFRGRVVKRKFDESGLIIIGAVLEFDDGDAGICEHRSRHRGYGPHTDRLGCSGPAETCQRRTGRFA